MINYIDIHTHTYYTSPDTTIVLNVFAHETDKLSLPAFKSIGLHPWHIEEQNWEFHLKQVKKAADSVNVIAIGESGLDKAIVTDYKLQEEIFETHLEIAEAVKKPLIIHCVRSYSEMLSYRKKFHPKFPWIFHWFNSDLQVANELIRKNCYLSFGHMLFNEQSKAFRTFTGISPDHIFFETDDAGFPIQQIYEKGASLLNMNVSDLKKMIMDNFTRCFQL